MVLWLINNRKWLILLVVVSGLVWLGFQMKSVVDKPVLAQAHEQASQAIAESKQVNRARAVEQALNASDVQTSTQYQKGMEDGKQQLQRALDRLNAALRLRNQQLTAVQQRGVPTAASAPGGYNGAAGSDFLTAHGADALQLANDADDVTRQLTACQQLLQERQQMTP